MKRTLVLVIALFMGIVFVTGASAQVDPAEKSDATPAKRIKVTEPVRRFMGEVVSVDSGAKTFVARGRKGELTFDATRAHISPAVRLGEMKAGDRVAVIYIEKDGKNMAKAVGKPAARAKRPRPGEDTSAAGKPAANPESR